MRALSKTLTTRQKEDQGESQAWHAWKTRRPQFRPGFRSSDWNVVRKNFMYQTSITLLVLLIVFLVDPSSLAAQSKDVSLQQISEKVQSYIEKSRGWKHETADPPTPPGSRPSPDVMIHFWSSEKCLTAEVRIDRKSYGAQAVSCNIKLAIDQSASAIAARDRLGNFVHNDRERNFTPLPLGDKGYLWNGSSVVFVKGKFTFWLSGRVDLAVGDFSITREFMDNLARDISAAIAG